MLAQSQSSQAAFVGVRSTFYRLANVFGNGVIVAVAGLLETRTGNIPLSWQLTVGGSGILLTGLTLYHTFAIPKPESDVPNIQEDSGNKVAEIFAGFGRTVTTYFKKPGVWLAIIFMLCYRLPEALPYQDVHPVPCGCERGRRTWDADRAGRHSVRYPRRDIRFFSEGSSEDFSHHVLG